MVSQETEGEHVYDTWDDKQNHFKHLVSVKVRDNQTSFDFFGSANDYDKGIDQLDKDGLSDALASFFEDALAGVEYEDIDDFASEFGYKKVSRTIKAWEGCKEAYRKAFSLGFDEDSLREWVNFLHDSEGKVLCGDCSKKLTDENRYSDYTCKDCAKDLGLDEIEP